MLQNPAVKIVLGVGLAVGAVLATPVLAQPPSPAAPAAAQVTGPPDVRFEIVASGLWQVEYSLDSPNDDRSGPGIAGGATLRLGKRLALGADIAWIHTSDSRHPHSEEDTVITSAASLLWHFGHRPVQPYLGAGIVHRRLKSCYAYSPRVGRDCFSGSEDSPILQVGLKIIGNRGLLVATEVRFEVIQLRVGISVGWTWSKGT